MTYGNQPGGYSGIAKALHWSVAACVIVQIPVAFAMVNASPGDLQNTLYNLHKSLGVLIFLLMILRLANRLIAGAPAPEPTIERWQRALSSAVHGLLYTLLLIMPIVGYVANSAFGASTPFFGLFEIKPLIGKNEALSDWLFWLHRMTGYAIAILVFMHVGGALQHFVIRRDTVLQRMLPRALGGI